MGTPTRFVQIIDFETDRMEEMRALVQKSDARHAGREGGPRHRLVLQDRSRPNRFLVVIEFDSYDEAMRDSGDPETSRRSNWPRCVRGRRPSRTAPYGRRPS